MAIIRLRSLAIKLSSSTAAHNLTRSSTTCSCYNNVIKASPKPGINNSSFISNYTKFSPYDHARNYSCYNVIRDSLESGINSLVTKGEKSSSSIDQDLKKVIATYTSDVWISMENLIKKYHQTQLVLNYGMVVLDFSLLNDHDLDNYNAGRLAFASTGGSMGGSNFPRVSGSSSGSSLTSSGRNSYSPSYRSYQGPNRRGNDDGSDLTFIIAFLVIAFLITILSENASTPKNSVIKLQVGLSGTVRSLQKDLNTICKTADTSGEAGYRYILQETAAALIRNPHHCITCCSSLDVNRDIGKSEKEYRRLFMKERSKIDELTLVNVNNNKKEKETSGRSNVFNSEYIVVTIIVCATGVHRLPPIKNREDFKKALQMLASIPNQIMGIEVLWTPQMKDDILTREEMLQNYPQLQPIDETVEKWLT